jgi:tetratricopeptide (TPR) repeat protein
MEGRRSLTLALCLLTGAGGCTLLPEQPAGQPVAAAKNDKEAKRQPLASTCMAYGNFAVISSTDPACTPAKRQQFQEQARKAYQQALDISPDYLPALVALGWLYVSLDDHDRALASFERAVQTHPQDSSAWFELGRFQARYHNWLTALDDLRRAVDLAPENHTYTHFYGYSLAHAGNYDESFMVFSKLEGDAKAHFELAQMLHHMKNDDLCKTHLEKALELDPQLTDAKQLLASLSSEAAQVGAQEQVH